MRLSIYLETRTFELVVHGVDIADALGVAPPDFGAGCGPALGLPPPSSRSPGAPILVRALTGRD